MLSLLRHLPSLIALLASTVALAISLNVFQTQTVPQYAQSSTLFTAAEAEEIGKLSRAYLIENPETIRDAIQILQAKEEAEKATHQSAAVTQYKEQILIDPQSPIAGNPQGDVILVEFFDYKCPYCKQVSPALEALIKEDPNLKIIFKELPILGEPSALAARAALAAAKQGKYFSYHQALMAYRRQLDLDSVISLANSVDLNTEQLLIDMKSADVEQQLTSNRKLALALGITSTPTFIVGDKVIPGALSIENLKDLIKDTRGGS